MDRRRVSILAASLALLFAAGGCQDYNFNPVGHCLIQPGTKRVTLSDVSTADVLFVVDDSGSMASEQASLGANFSQFLDVLVTANQQRASQIPPLEAIDFHIAVTSTSNFYNPTTLHGSICSTSCPGASGSKVCCLQGTASPPADPPLVSPQPPLCGDDSECAAGYSCRSDCQGSLSVGGNACCLDAAPHAAQRIACATVGEPCGDLDQHYYYDGVCDPSYIGPANQGLRAIHYPQGDFMAAPGNDKVIHFTKGLGWAGGTSDPTITPLSADFSQNVDVGTCGSPQEQGLEAARLAVAKALDGDQALPKCPSDWTPASTLKCWPHPKAKLVVVWVTDENDSSSPTSASTGVVATTPDNSSSEEVARKYEVARFADYFTSLGRPVGAAFIASANVGCVDVDCNPQVCCSGPGCSGSEAAPTRYFELASQLRARGVDVVVGSICDSFGTTLGRIGEIVKPPTGLVLPTQPAASDVTILRIARPDGTTRKTCSRPAPPPADPSSITTDPQAQAYIDTVSATYDWWFTADREQITPLQKLPTASSQFVFINHLTGNCEANPGETYSADYLGQLPPGGCDNENDCADALGGSPSQWNCEGEDALAGRKGTCLCN